MDIQIFLINLKRSTIRFEQMDQQLKSLDIPYILFEAIDGHNLTEKHLEQYSSKHSFLLHNRDLLKGEIGCALSHIELYQKIVKENIPISIILEDDLIIKKEFKEFLLIIKDIINDDWEFLNLCSFTPCVLAEKLFYKNFKYTVFTGHATGTCAQVIKLSAAKRLLEHAFPIRFAADGLTGRFSETGLKMLGVYPNLVSLREIESDICLTT